jgi:hypothetical protein
MMRGMIVDDCQGSGDEFPGLFLSVRCCPGPCFFQANTGDEG